MICSVYPSVESSARCRYWDMSSEPCHDPFHPNNYFPRSSCLCTPQLNPESALSRKLVGHAHLIGMAWRHVSMKLEGVIKYDSSSDVMTLTGDVSPGYVCISGHERWLSNRGSVFEDGEKNRGKWFSGGVSLMMELDPQFNNLMRESGRYEWHWIIIGKSFY